MKTGKYLFSWKVNWIHNEILYECSHVNLFNTGTSFTKPRLKGN